VRTLHSCCIKFPDTAPTVIPLLMEFLSDGSDDMAAQVPIQPKVSNIGLQIFVITNIFKLKMITA
jgi:hypothetical protein